MSLSFKPGRQGTGYEVMTLISRKLPFRRLSGVDLHILRYPPSSSVPTHVDKVASGNHHRINVILVKPKSGGEFICARATRLLGGTLGALLPFGQGRVFYFRPDIMEHAVTECPSKRVVLSIGWVTNG